MLATMITGRVADLSSQHQAAVELYSSAKAIAVSVGNKYLALECSKRRAILNAMDQEQLEKVVEKYGLKFKQLREKRGDPLEKNKTTSTVTPLNQCRIRVKFQDEEEMAKTMKEIEGGMEARGGGESLSYQPITLRQCAGCQKDDMKNSFKRCARCTSVVYCSVDCQREHWKVHKKICRKLDRAEGK